MKIRCLGALLAVFCGAAAAQAASVAAEMDSGKLVVRNSTSGGDCIVRMTSLGEGVLVEGVGSTTINGQASDLLPHPTNGVFVQLLNSNPDRTKLIASKLMLDGNQDLIDGWIVHVDGSAFLEACSCGPGARMEVKARYVTILNCVGGFDSDISVGIPRGFSYRDTAFKVDGCQNFDLCSIGGTDVRDRIYVLDSRFNGVVDIDSRGDDDVVWVEDVDADALVVTCGWGADRIYVFDNGIFAQPLIDGGLNPPNIGDKCWQGNNNFTLNWGNTDGVELFY